MVTNKTLSDYLGVLSRETLILYIFLICMKGFSYKIKQYEIRRLSIFRYSSVVTYLFFTYDSIIFSEGNIKDKIMHILDLYASVNGQCANFNKSTIAFSPNIPE